MNETETRLLARVADLEDQLLAACSARAVELAADTSQRLALVPTVGNHPSLSPELAAHVDAAQRALTVVR